MPSSSSRSPKIGGRLKNSSPKSRAVQEQPSPSSLHSVSFPIVDDPGRSPHRLHRTYSFPQPDSDRKQRYGENELRRVFSNNSSVVNQAKKEKGKEVEDRQDLVLARRFMNTSKSEPWAKGPSTFLTLPANWWLERGSRRPWKQGEVVQRKGSLHAAQEDRWVQTRSRVALALRSVLGTALDVTHEVLIIGSDALEFAPIPGLGEAAQILLSIWEAVQLVETNRMACLRLTERCADILLNVREEIHDAGDIISAELGEPLMKLTGTFEAIYVLMHRLVRRPFLKRYLKRDETLIQINACHTALTDALSLFSFAVQMRSWRQHQAADMQQQAQLAELLANSRAALAQAEDLTPRPNTISLPPIPESYAVPTTGLPPAPATGLGLSLTGEEHSSTIHETPPTSAKSDISEHGSETSSSAEILDNIHRIVTRHQESDFTADMQDLRQIMRTALATSNDMQMLQALQVQREEMPEAIKTLQRALERVSPERDLGDEEQHAHDHGYEIASRGLGLDVDLGDSMVGTTRPISIASVAGVVPVIHTHTPSPTDSSTQSKGTAESWMTSIVGQNDTLDREFIEGGIDALRRMSGLDISLPSYTITRYEIDLEEKVGIGFFSDVYKGTWRNRTVAIKILAPTTPKSLFEHEMVVWKYLRHPNVLPLLGTSSTLRDPPWFFVSPYMKNGSLVEFLRKMGPGDVWNPVRMVYEIAKGMAYLHGMEMLHGDLKGTNVLIDDHLQCVLADFGLSEMKSEAYRLSGTARPHGALRWQAPELIDGATSGERTRQTDIYAFAIVCVEILAHGALPWPSMDDDTVRHAVLHENRRPIIPSTNVSTGLISIIQSAWDRDSTARPSFSTIVRDLRRMRGKTTESPLPSTLTDLWNNEDHQTKKSPDIQPVPLPNTEDGPAGLDEGNLSPPLLADTAATLYPMHRAITPEYRTTKHSSSGDSSDLGPIFTASQGPSTGDKTSSISSSPSTTTSRSSYSEVTDWREIMRVNSPLPVDEISKQRKNESRYRLLLQHEFHPSLKLPLWDPSPVELGAIGYLSKPMGSFVTLFNTFSPATSSEGKAQNIPSLYGYGRVTKGSQRQDKRNVAQRGLDAIQGFISARSPDSSVAVARSYNFPLRAGHKSAYLCSETTMYRYVDNLKTPKAWFKANVDHVLKLYGREHRLQQEDLLLVIGTLDAPDYGLFINHNNPDGQAQFNVFSGPRPGQNWGAFSVNTECPSPIPGGPWYDEDVPGRHSSASKVSVLRASRAWNTVLLARLRFKPDSDEPTSL